MLGLLLWPLNLMLKFDMENKIRPVRLVQDILRKNLVLNPDKIALICENTRLTYAQIDEMSDRLAHAFVANGIKEGDRILFYTLNSVELVVSIFASLKANAIYVGVDSGNTYETLLYIANDCQISAIVTYDHRAESVKRLFEDLPSLKMGILTGPKTNDLTDKILSYNQIQENYSPFAPPQTRIENDLAFMIYTSGSTGFSKGVMVTHRSILFTINCGIEFLELTDNEVHTCPLQLSFSPGINQLYQTFMVGGTLILEKSLAFPMMMIKRMANERATGFAGVPTILTLLMEMDLSKYDLSSLRFFSSVGASLPLPLIDKIYQKFPRISIYSYYGMAEASYSLVLHPDQIRIRPTSVGKPFPGTQAWIIDEDGNRLAHGETGQLVLRGSHVRSGYWNNPEETSCRYRPGLVSGERVCYTGDIFSMDEEGYLYFIGRSDEIIKSGAKKVVPKEIETALYGMNGVIEAAAIGVPDNVLGHAIKAFVVLTKEMEQFITTEIIMQHCKQTLETFKVPKEIVIVNSLPKSTSGKIIKKNLT